MTGLFLLLVALVVPAVASFALPDRVRWVLAAGPLLAMGLWISSWFADPGYESRRREVIIFAAFVCAFLLAVWTMSASIGWALRRRRHVLSVYRRLQEGSRKRRRRLI